MGMLEVNTGVVALHVGQRVQPALCPTGDCGELPVEWALFLPRGVGTSTSYRLSD